MNTHAIGLRNIFYFFSIIMALLVWLWSQLIGVNELHSNPSFHPFIQLHRRTYKPTCKYCNLSQWITSGECNSLAFHTGCRQRNSLHRANKRHLTAAGMLKRICGDLKVFPEIHDWQKEEEGYAKWKRKRKKTMWLIFNSCTYPYTL